MTGLWFKDCGCCALYILYRNKDAKWFIASSNGGDRGWVSGQRDFKIKQGFSDVLFHINYTPRKKKSIIRLELAMPCVRPID